MSRDEHYGASKGKLVITLVLAVIHLLAGFFNFIGIFMVYYCGM